MPEMKPFLGEKWRRFLSDLDSALPEAVQVHCLGGFVLGVCYGLPRPTGDVDYITASPRSGADKLQALAGEGSQLARRHGLHFQYVTVAEVPEDYEQRLIQILADDFVRRRLFALEVHDLVLAKLSRNHPRDLEDARFLAGAGWLERGILQERYQKEVRPNLSNERRHDLTLQLWLEACFGS